MPTPRARAVINILLPVLVLLTLIDLTATVFWVASGIATEANPILEAVNQKSQKSFLSFAAIKISLAFAGVLILRHHKKKKIVFDLAMAAVFVYLGVTAWHVVGLLMVL